jgi:IclR family KDG regulon transcriptional repressor
MSQHVNSGSNNETNSSYSLSTTVIKAFTILEYISRHQPVQPSEIVKALHLTRANVHRLLATFMSIGYVRKDHQGYGLTFKLFQLGSSVPLNKSLRDVAKPVMNDLEKIAEENIYLNVLTTDVVVAIDEVKSPHHVILNPDVTYMYPIYACASGKVLVSDMPDDELWQLIDEMEFVKRTERTVGSRQEFYEAVLDARKNGCAMELQEFSRDLNSMAAPVRDCNDSIVASISISGPSMRLTEYLLTTLRDPLKEAAQKITDRLRMDRSSLYGEE